MKCFPYVLVLSFWFGGLLGHALAQDKAAAYYQAGNIFYGQNKYDEAIHYFESATQANPDLWQAYQGEGSCYYAKGEKAKSLPYFQKALNLNRNNPSLAAFINNLRSQVAATQAATPTPTSVYERNK